MAYFRKRGKSWSFTVDVGKDPQTGERKQETKGGFRKKQDAELAAAKVIADVARGTYVKEEDIVFSKFAERWLSYYEATGRVKTGTVIIRRGRVKKLNTYFGALKMSEITRANYQNMLLDLYKKGLADETISSTHSTAKLIFRYAMEQEVIKSNPTEYAKLPKRQQTVEDIEGHTELPKYLEKQQLMNLLETAKGKGLPNDYAAFMTLAYTGMRIGEMLVLKWRDIDFENLTISITKTYQSIRNNTKLYQLVTPKTKSSIRVIEIDMTLAAVLEDHRTKIRALQEKIGDTYHDKDFVFPKTRRYAGYPEIQKTFESRMERLLKIAGLPETLTPHSLRHTHTTLLAEAGVGLTEIQHRLGHKDEAMTKHIYLHVTKTMKREAADRFGELMKHVSKL